MVGKDVDDDVGFKTDGEGNTFQVLNFAVEELGA